MGTDNLNPRENGQVIDETWFGKIKRALCGNFYPRNTTTLDVEHEAGSLGTQTYKFKNAYIESGYLCAGMMKYFKWVTGKNDSIVAGWMLCDGSQITEANYNSQHGAGAWAAHGISSPLLNKYLPIDNLHLRGTTAATAATTPTVLGNRTVDLTHDHGGSATVTQFTGADAAASGSGATAIVQSHKHTLAVNSKVWTGIETDLNAVTFRLYMRII